MIMPMTASLATGLGREGPPAGSSAAPVRLAPFARGPVLATAAVMCTLELAMASRYGIHRDELYFIACARHLSWGYVDQPPLVPAVARVVLDLFGPVTFWLRVPSALAGAATVVMTGLSARQLGGGSRAQTVAAVATATSAQNLAAFHLLSTAEFDIFLWSVLTYLFLRMLRAEDPRWWAAIGAIGGVALLNKLNVGFLVIGIAAGLVVCRRWALLRTRWLLVGTGLAVALASPDVIWNATHHWAQLSMLHNLHQENSTVGASLGFIPSQLIVVGPVLAWVWIPGTKRLLNHPVGRPLGVAFVVLLGLYALVGAKSYYLAGVYPVVFAGGGLLVEERLAARRTNSPRTAAPRIAAMVAGAVVALPLVLPVIPESALATGTWEGSINKDLSATVGWKDMTRQIATIVSTVPSSEHDRLVLYTGDYGAAGAIDLYGPSYGLPHAISGHNNYWWWGPSDAPDKSITIAIDLPASFLRTMFAHVEPAGVVTTPHNIWTEERDDPIWICTGQTESWAQAWPAARHYD